MQLEPQLPHMHADRAVLDDAVILGLPKTALPMRCSLRSWGWPCRVLSARKRNRSLRRADFWKELLAVILSINCHLGSVRISESTSIIRV